jgi:hypothetical protein
LDYWGIVFRFPACVGDFSVLQSVHVGSGSHPSFCPVGLWRIPFLGEGGGVINWRRTVLTTLLPPSGEVMNQWICTSSNCILSWNPLKQIYYHYYYKFVSVGSMKCIFTGQNNNGKSSRPNIISILHIWNLLIIL